MYQNSKQLISSSHPMAPLQPWGASPSPSPSHQYNSKNLRSGLQQEGAGAGAVASSGSASGSASASAGKRLRLGTNHLPPERSASFHGRSMNAAASTDPHQTKQMRRPKTQPDLIAAAGGRSKNIIVMTSSPTPGDLSRFGSMNATSTTGDQMQMQMQMPMPMPMQMQMQMQMPMTMRKLPAKVLVNVNVQRSLGALQVMASTEWTVHQLVPAALNQYVKEGRRPLLPTTDPSAFGLHYSQFSLECLDSKEKLMGLGSRNFFLCPKTKTKTKTATATAVSASTLPAAGSGSVSTSSPSSCSKEADKSSKITIPWLRFMDFLF